MSKFLDIHGLSTYDRKLKEWTQNQIQPADWKESDPTSKAYIQNRTHYCDLTLETTVEDTVKKCYWSTDLLKNDLEELEYLINPAYYYYVQVDDNEPVKLAPYTVNGGGESFICLGNSDLAPVIVPASRRQNTDLNFIIGGVPNRNVYYGGFGCTVPGEHTVILTCNGELINENPEITYIIVNNSKLETAFANVDMEALAEAETTSVVIDGTSYTVHAQDITILGDTAHIFGNCRLLYNLAAASGIDFEYDATLDSDVPLCFWPDNDGMVLTNTDTITELQVAGSETIELESADFQAAQNEFDPPSSEPYTYNATCAVNGTEWWRTIVVLGKTQSLQLGNKYRVTIGDTEFLLEAGDLSDYTSDYMCPTFNGSQSNGRFLGDVTALQDLISMYSGGSRDTTATVTYSEYPFLIVDYEIGSSLIQHFTELHLKDEFYEQPVSVTLDTVTNMDLKQLDKQFIPNPDWTEVTRKPDFSSEKDIIDVVWGEVDAETLSDLSNFFVVDSEWTQEEIAYCRLRMKDHTEVTLDYPVTLPEEFDGKVVQSFSRSSTTAYGPGIYNLHTTKVYVPACYTALPVMPSDIEQVFIESGSPITTISNNDFKNYGNLIFIQLPENLVSIGDYAFQGCASLESVTLPEGLTTIRPNAFYQSGLKTIRIPDSVTGIGEYAFGICRDLTSVVMGNSVTDLLGTFSGCSKLTSVKLGTGLVTLNSNVFVNCTSLEEIEIPAAVTLIGEYVFGNCSSLKSVTLPEGLLTIQSGAFEECTSLTSITLPESLTTLGSLAFRNCSNLTQINLPDTLSISENPFAGCSSLQTITVSEDNPNFTFENGLLLNKAKTKIIAAPTASGDYTVGSAITAIGSRAFSHNTAVTHITLPEGLTSVEWLAFERCSNLTHVTFPSTLTGTIREMFYECPALTEIILPEGITTVNGLVTDANALQTVVFPDSCTSISSWVLSNCRNIQDVTIGPNIATLNGIFNSWVYIRNSLTLKKTSVQAVTSNTYSRNYLTQALQYIQAIYVPADLVESYKTAAFWSTYANKIQAITV